MARFNLDDYETVEQRLSRFWADHPEGRVLTSIVHHDSSRFVVRAEIYFDRESGIIASGHAEEIVGSNPINKISALENGETSAIGRALANCNYSGIGKRPSREEMEKVERYESNKPLSKASKPLLAIVPPTPEQYERAEKLLASISGIQSKPELKNIWETNSDLLDIKVSGTTLKDAIGARAQALS